MDLPQNYHSDSSLSSSPEPSVQDSSNRQSGHDSHEPLYHLKIISYGFKLGPLPPARENQRQLDYDLSDIANPPGVVRDGNTGLHPEIQCATLAERESKSRLKRILREIKAAMDDIEALDPPDSNSVRVELVVALACGSGKHRSVTFAEQTCRYFQRTRNKRESWGVTVEHRDLRVGHDHEHLDDDEVDDGHGMYEGDYAILSKSRSEHLENDVKGDTGNKRERNQEEATRNIRQTEDGARVLEAPR